MKMTIYFKLNKPIEVKTTQSIKIKKMKILKKKIIFNNNNNSIISNQNLDGYNTHFLI